MNALVVSDTLRSIEGRFTEMAKSNIGINFENEANYACMILQNNSYLEGIARNNPSSLQAAVLNAAGSGISLNPVMKHAYLVPRYVNGSNMICLDVSYMGLIHLACQTKSVSWIHAEVARENDDFHVGSIDEAPQHKYKPFGGDRGEVVGVYCVAKLMDGSYLTRTMTIDEVNEIRDRSESWKAYKNPNKNVKTSPWLTDFEEMAKKTVIKRASKTWPRVDSRFTKVVDVLNNTDGIDFKEEAGLPKPEIIDYKLREDQIEQVLGLLTELGEDKDRKGKMDLLKKHTGFISFEDVKIQNNSSLDKIIISLTTEKTAMAVDEKNTMPFVPENQKDIEAEVTVSTVRENFEKSQAEELKKQPEEKKSAKDVTFTIK